MVISGLRYALLSGIFSLLLVRTTPAGMVNFEKPQTPANFPALFYPSAGKPVVVNKTTGGVTVTFTGGELLTDPKGLLFPGRNSGNNANKSTFYASQFPPTLGLSGLIKVTFSKPVDNLTFELMNNTGDELNFAFTVNSKNAGGVTLKDDYNQIITPPLGPRHNVKSLTIRVGGAWRFGVDDFEYTVSSIPEPSSLMLASISVVVLVGYIVTK